MWYLERWNKYYQYLKEYYAEYGTANVPADYITDDGFCLGTWVVYQRTKERNGLLSEEQKQLLDQVSMIWNLKDDKWDSNYSKLLEYYDKYGNIDIAPSYVTEDGYHLGSWLTTFRQAYKGKGKRKLSQEQISMFNDLDIDWSKQDTKVLNSEIVKGCCFDKYKKIMLERMKHILEDLSYEVNGNISNGDKQKMLEKEIIKRMWR